MVYKNLGYNKMKKSKLIRVFDFVTNKFLPVQNELKNLIVCLYNELIHPYKFRYVFFFFYD